MGAKSRRKMRRAFENYVRHNPSDGLKVNTVNDCYRVASASMMTIYDDDSLAEIRDGKVIRIGIVCEVRRVNRWKAVKLNRYKNLIDGSR